MPRGGKSKYSGKQKHQAEHVEKGYEKHGVSEGEAERRAWATVNKMTGGGKATNNTPARKGGGIGGKAAAKRSAAAKSASARKAAATRKRKSGKKG